MTAPLRLTLRTLLSYLDDTLDPAQAKLIGQKVAESEQARELMERIKQVTRKRRLTTPPPAGPGGIDANTIAEYLDNEVTREQSEEVEQICLASDVHLAEVAACHQILTLVLGEPALVPPSARQRMYGLVKGPEAIPFRKPPRAAKPDLDLSTSDAGHDVDESLRLPGVFGAAGTRNAALLAGGGVVAACLLVFALYMLFRTPPGGENKDTPIVQADSGKKEKDNEKPNKDADKPNKDDKPKDDKPAKDKEDKLNKDADKSAKEKDKEDKPNKDADKPAKDSEDSQPGKPPAVGEEIPFSPPDLKPAVLGQYDPDPTKPAILLQKGPGDKAAWERLWGKSLDVVGGRTLMSLPCMRNEVEFKRGVHLWLWGTSPEQWPNPWVNECIVEVYQHSVLDLDLLLKRGRIMLMNNRPRGKPVVVRVRFDNPTQKKEAYFDIALKGEEATVAIERFAALPQDEPFFEDPMHANRRGPTADMFAFFLKGAGHIRTSDVAFAVDASKEPQMVIWSSTRGLDSPQAYTPDWILQKPELGDPAMRKKANEAALLLAKNVQGKKLDVALQEALESKDDAVRRLALRCYAALDQFGRPLEILDQDKTGDDEMRRMAVYVLRSWMAQERDNEYKLYDALREQQLGKRVATKVMQLLHGISKTEMGQPDTWQQLIEDLNNPVMALRELSAWNLYILVPHISAQIQYAPSASEAVRAKAIEQWRKRVPPGKLPPPPPKK